MLRIGITGGIGSGKTEVTRFFQERGAQIFDADAEAKLILLHSEKVQQAVLAAFGEAILNEVGEIDFRLLAEQAFTNPERQRRLNEIIHPEVILAADEAMVQAGQDGIDLFILDAPLLFEAHLEEYLDLTIVMVAKEETRIRRALKRGNLTEEEIRRRIHLQLPDDEKRSRADVVITNNGTLAQLHAKLDTLLANLTGT
ncbi:MAG: dephospho-CoA kinase [Candidatus Neomarinimicrobiota bacterium]